MAGFHVAIVPVGKIDATDLEPAISRAAKAIRQPFELRGSLTVPTGTEDPVRGQHRASILLQRLRADSARLAPGRLIGGDDPEAKAPLTADGFIFITDVDMFTAKTDGVLAALNSKIQSAVISLRRQREAYYKRKANPNRQRERLIKEILRMWGRLQKVGQCNDADCPLSPSPTLPAIDGKLEHYCRACSQNLFEGRIEI